MGYAEQEQTLIVVDVLMLVSKLLFSPYTKPQLTLGIMG